MSSRNAYLVVTPYLPGPDSLHAGGRASAAWLLELQELGDVDLVALGSGADAATARRAWPRLRSVTLVRYRSGFTERLLGMLGDLFRGVAGGVQARLRRAVRQCLRERAYAAVLVEHEETALWLELGSVPARLILDCHDVISGHFEHDSAANPAPELVPSVRAAREAEERLLRRYDRVLVRSRADLARLRALVPTADVRLLRHPIVIPGDVQPRGRRLPRRLLLTGSFRRAPNVAAARLALEEVLPRLRPRYPDVTLDIIGDGATESLAAGAAAGVRILGRQPDLAAYYRQAFLFLNPTRAAGGVITRHLDALAHGLPVVTTPAGAEGLDLGDVVLTATEPDELAGAVARLFEDAALWDRCSAAGRAAVAAHHAEPVVAEQFRTLVCSLSADCERPGGPQ